MNSEIIKKSSTVGSKYVVLNWQNGDTDCYLTKLKTMELVKSDFVKKRPYSQINSCSINNMGQFVLELA